MEDGEPAASPQPERLDEEPEKRLTYAANLLEDNAALVFKLNGLAMLRRRATGSCTPPSAEEQQWLAQAQARLQEVAVQLPPKILMPQGMAQRLRQQLQNSVTVPVERQAAAAAAAAAAGEGPATAVSAEVAVAAAQGVPSAGGAAAAAVQSPGGRKRKLSIKEAEGDAREADLEVLEQQEELIVEGAQGDQRQQHTAQLQQLLAAQAAQAQAQQGHPGSMPPVGSGGTAAALYARPPSGGHPGAALMGANQQHGMSALQQGMSQQQGVSAASQGSMSGLLAPGGGRRGLVPAAARLQQLQQQQFAQQYQHQQAGAQLPSMLAEPMAREDMFLLSQAYSSMTAEQKEKLAAQPPEIRQYVMRERMRKTREQLEGLQAQRAAAAAAGLMAQPVAQPHDIVWGGSAAGTATQQQLPEWLRGGGQTATPLLVPAPPGGFQQQQQQHFQMQQAPSLELAHSLQMQRMPSLRPEYSVLAMQSPQAQPQLFQQQQQQQQPQLFQQQQQLFQQQGLGQMLQQQQQSDELLPPALVPGRGISPPTMGMGGVGPPMPNSAPFVAMSEAGRLEHLRQLKRRQEEWLEQQRLAAAAMAGQN